MSTLQQKIADYPGMIGNWGNTRFISLKVERGLERDMNSVLPISGTGHGATSAMSAMPGYAVDLTLDARNLGAFETEAGHQALLVENESVGIIFQR